MRINSISLANIRSYMKETVEFSEGSVLLSGDIGHGKSSLLLAIEFALFGIRTNELSGDELLREGEREGSVTLSYTVDGKEYQVKRTLRRRGDSVGQHSGSFSVDGSRESLSASELKARVLQSLGYPEELVSKHHSYIYRYTVYTPQETMKDIIYASEERRLETLRKIFGINRYKRIRDNASSVRAELRSMQREFKGMVQGLDDDKQDLKDFKGFVKEKKESLDQVQKVHKSLQEKVSEQKKEWENAREQLEKYTKVNTEKEKSETQLNGLEKQVQEKNAHIQELQKNLEEFKELQRPTDQTEEDLEHKKSQIQEQKERIIKDPHGINDDIDHLFDEITSIQEHIQKGEETKNTLKGKIGSSEDAIDELREAGDICPVCGSALSEEHKQEEIQRNQTKIEEYKKQQQEINEQKETLTKRQGEIQKNIDAQVKQILDELKAKFTQLSKVEKELRTYLQLVEKKKQIKEQLSKDQEGLTKLQQEKQKISKNIDEYKKQLTEFQDIKTKEKQAHETLEQVQNKFHEIDNTRTGLQKDIENGKQNIETLELTIQKKEKALSLKKTFSSYEDWLGTYLSNLAGTVERHFMLHLQKKFNSVFGRWYQQLIDDPSLSVRVDDNFTPKIEREGYETLFRRLSGGEKTSVALAYRLALNTVINTMIEEIKTRDLIILDEPTDGFSSHQLDKVRDVINELGMRQTILVSHEPKMESYVDEIINIRKEDGVSHATG